MHLHKLVHDAHWAAGRWTCAEEREWYTHLVQHADLADHGLDSGLDFSVLAEKATCPADWLAGRVSIRAQSVSETASRRATKEGRGEPLPPPVIEMSDSVERAD